VIGAAIPKYHPGLLSGLATGAQKAVYGLDTDNNLVIINPRTAMTKVLGKHRITN
jgi:hypothetical protein